MTKTKKRNIVVRFLRIWLETFIEKGRIGKYIPMQEAIEGGYKWFGPFEISLGDIDDDNSQIKIKVFTDKEKEKIDRLDRKMRRVYAIIFKKR